MLDTLRANSRSVLTYVLFGIIIVVFVISFGPGSRGCSGGGRAESWAAKVNGETVTPGEFDQQYAQLLRFYQQQGAGDPSGLLQARLRQLAMDQVVQRELIEQEADRQGIVVSDDEVASAVKAMPAFQSAGSFDVDLYKRTVSGLYGSPGKFEERLRRDLAYTKMLTLLRGTAKVTDDEVKDAWLAESDTVDLEVVRFPLQQARQEVKPTDAQVADFAARNGDRIEKFYKDNPARFDKKKQVHARHILVRVAEKASADDVAAAKKRIDDAAKRIAAGEDFAKVAQEVSEDPGSKDRGGDLGFFGQGVMAKSFEDQAFKMKPGEVSPPFRSPFGWHLVKVEAVKEPEVVPLEKARPEIAREMLESELAEKLAAQRAAEGLRRLQAWRNAAEAFPAEASAGRRGPEPMKLGGQVVKPEDTGPFEAGTSPNVPRLGPAPELFADAVAANAGQVLPKVYSTPAGPAIARVKERERPDVAKFPEHRQETEARLRLRREAEIERAWVSDLKSRAKVQTNKAFVLGEARPSQADLD